MPWACKFLKKTPIQVLSCEVCKTFKNKGVTLFWEYLQTTASGGVL